jgi:hypothetical protein
MTRLDKIPKYVTEITKTVTIPEFQKLFKEKHKYHLKPNINMKIYFPNISKNVLDDFIRHLLICEEIKNEDVTKLPNYKNSYFEMKISYKYWEEEPTSIWIDSFEMKIIKKSKK